METLRPIPGFTGYFASPDGTIWTQKRKGGNDRGAGRLLDKPRPLKAHYTGAGYLAVALDFGGRVCSRLVHRLILETFVGPAPDGYYGCHYPDPTKSNNRLDNLRWDSAVGNAKDRYRDKVPAAEKRCTRCGAIRHVSQFYNDKRSINGLQAECKRCHSSTVMMTRDRDGKREANREYMRRKRQVDPGYCH